MNSVIKAVIKITIVIIISLIEPIGNLISKTQNQCYEIKEAQEL